MCLATNSIALSISIPLGAPSTLRISPPNGAVGLAGDAGGAKRGAVRDRRMTIGSSKEDGIVRRDFVQLSRPSGNSGGLQKVSIQPRPVIHFPGSVFATRSFTLARKSSRVFVPSRFNVISRSPIPKMWQCASVSPGTTVAPLRSIAPRLLAPVCFGVFARNRRRQCDRLLPRSLRLSVAPRFRCKCCRLERWCRLALARGPREAAQTSRNKIASGTHRA